MNSAHRCLAVASIAAGAALAGCASRTPPAPPMLSVTIHASPTLNPDTQGRPSPVLVRIYALRARDAFDRATFFELYDHDARVLDQAVLDRVEISVRPGETVPLVRPLDPATRAIAIMAAYERIDDAKWRASVPLGKPSAAEFSATLERSALTLSGTGRAPEEPKRGLLMRWLHPVWKAATSLIGKQK